MQSHWYRTAWRRNVVDMHIADWNAQFMARFDPAEYAALMARGGAQSAVLYAHSHAGSCYYPTRVGHRHRGLKGRDIFGETVAELHRRGIHVVAYISLVYDTVTSDAHQDWRIRLADGRDAGAGTRYGTCCPNSPYREHVRSLIAELCGTYAVEGLRCDMTFWPAVCYCPHCRERYGREVGGAPPTVVNWEDPGWVRFQRKREAWLTEFAALATAAARRARPGITVEHQASTFLYSWIIGQTHALVDQNDFLQGDFYGGILQGSFVRKLLYNLTPSRPYGFETTSNLGLNDHTTLKPPELLELKACSALANGGAFVFIDAVDPVGTLNPRVYERMGGVFAKTRAYEPHLGGDLCQDVAVYWSLDSRFNPADNGKDVAAASANLWTLALPHLDAAMGVARACLHAHIPYGVITRRNLADLRRHRVLVLPDVLMMDREEVDAVRAFVRRGGTLYASGSTSLLASDGTRQPDFMLADVFGASCDGRTDEDYTYIAPVGRGAALLPDYSAQYPLGLWSTQVKLRAQPESETLGLAALPYSLPREPRRFASIHSNPPGEVTDRPALVLNRYGKGLVIYAAMPIETNPAYDGIVAGLLRFLAARPFTVEAAAPRAVEITAFHQGRRKRYLVNLLNFQEQLPNIPARGIAVTLRTGRRKVRRVLKLPQEKPLPFRAANGSVTFTVPRLDNFVMAAVEYQ
jgi:hypothetical protein